MHAARLQFRHYKLLSKIAKNSIRNLNDFHYIKEHWCVVIHCHNQVGRGPVPAVTATKPIPAGLGDPRAKLYAAVLLPSQQLTTRMEADQRELRRCTPART